MKFAVNTYRNSSIRNCHFHGNHMEYGGNLIKIVGSSLDVDSCLFTQNLMKTKSSGINLMYSSLNLRKSVFDMKYDQVMADNIANVIPSA